MRKEPETETIEVEIRFLKLRAEEDPQAVLAATLAVCPRCPTRGLAVGQSECSVRNAIEAMANECPSLQPWIHDYVAPAGVEPPDDLLPA